MEHSVATAVATVVGVGVGAQWLARVLRVPSILLLLAAGFLVGPVLEIVDPAEQFGSLLFPLVSLGVGLLLFEGGLDLDLRKLEVGRSSVVRLVTVGVAMTWAIGTVAALALFDLSRGEAAILGAVLVVSGPTVVIPLLAQVRPRRRVATILRWEAILIDPVGATLGVVVLETLLHGGSTPLDAAVSVAATAAVGIALGLVTAAAVLVSVHRHWVPDDLEAPVGLAAVVVLFTVANGIYQEAGLFATTTMGLALVNQRRVAVGQLASFGVQLGPLILAGLFITLGALVDPAELDDVLAPTLLLLVVLLALARPLVVWVGTIGTDLTRNERMFVAAVAPRGVVAAAVASLFAIDLADAGRPLPELVPVTFVVIIGSVLVSGLGARPIAHRLRVDETAPRGLVLVGHAPWMLDLAAILTDLEVPILVIDPDSTEVARRVSTERGFLLSPRDLDADDLADAVRAAGAGQALIATPSAAANAYAVDRFAEILGRANVFHLPIDDPSARGTGGAEVAAVGRRPFGPQVTQRTIDELWQAGARLVVAPDPVGPAEGRTLVLLDEARAQLATGNAEASGPAIALVGAATSDRS